MRLRMDLNLLFLGPGQFGVIRRITAEEDKMENNTMYSCGSLAPKMKAKKDCQIFFRVKYP